MMFASSVAAALIGAVGGGLGALLGALFDRIAARRGSQVGAFVGIAVSIGVTTGTNLDDRLARVIDPPSEVELVGERMMEIPGVKARLDGKDASQIQATMQQLSAAGMVKLDDERLVTRARLMSAMFAKADERTCGGMARGNVGGEALMKLLQTLDPEPRAQWFDLINAAVEAEVGARAVTPRAPLSQEQIGEAVAELTSGLPEQQRLELLQNIGALGSLSDADACRSIRRLYELVDTSTGTVQATVARALVMQ